MWRRRPRQCINPSRGWLGYTCFFGRYVMTRRHNLMRLAIVSLLALVMLSKGAMAQSPTSSPTPAASQAATTTSGPTTSYTLPPDKLAKAKALYDLFGKLRIFATIYGFAILLALLYLGVAARFRDWAEKVSNNSFVQTLIVVPLLLLTLSVLHLP